MPQLFYSSISFRSSRISSIGRNSAPPKEISVAIHIAISSIAARGPNVLVIQGRVSWGQSSWKLSSRVRNRQRHGSIWRISQVFHRCELCWTRKLIGCYVVLARQQVRFDRYLGKVEKTWKCWDEKWRRCLMEGFKFLEWHTHLHARILQNTPPYWSRTTMLTSHISLHNSPRLTVPPVAQWSLASTSLYPRRNRIETKQLIKSTRIMPEWI